MSWSVTTAKQTLEEQLNQAIAAGNLDSASEEAAKAAAPLALQLASSGVVGTDPVISISGHANPNHVPTEGNPNDVLNITITDTSTATPVPVLQPLAVPEEPATEVTS